VGRALAAVPDVQRRFVAYAQQLVDRDLPVLFSQEHLARVVGLSRATLIELASDPPYRTFMVPKRRGGQRQIRAPRPMLKQVQGYLRRAITSRLPVSDQAHGFRTGRSIVTNARPHVGSELLLKLDLKDFFGTVDRGRVADLFRGLGYAPSVVALLADVCTLDGSLPQGAPTSPDLANAAALEMDNALQELAATHSIIYTRYADDMTFSGPNVRHARVRDDIKRLVEDHGFVLNTDKTALVSRAGQQRVTGIVVNEKVNWPRDMRRWLRTEIHNLDRLGLDAHLRRQALFHTDRPGPPHGAPRTRANYRDYIYGHVYALNSARPDEAAKYLALLDALPWPGIPKGAARDDDLVGDAAS
jgi:RNA-directed DNA polymerase